MDKDELGRSTLALKLALLDLFLPCSLGYAFVVPFPTLSFERMAGRKPLMCCCLWEEIYGMRDICAVMMRKHWILLSIEAVVINVWLTAVISESWSARVYHCNGTVLTFNRFVTLNGVLQQTGFAIVDVNELVRGWASA